jgi:nucleotidyltransferase substrate binding protein (TIGR01987 family)
MERLISKYKDLVKLTEALKSAIARYQEAQEDIKFDFKTREDRRDAIIKRFELSYDLLWKYLREYIGITNGIYLDSPRKVFQQCLPAGITNEAETAHLLTLIENRNQTTHVYNVELADKVAEIIPKNYDLIYAIVTRTNPMKNNTR